MKKYYFVPNREYNKDIDIRYSHRSEAFRDIYKSCKKKLGDIFEIPQEYEILFVNGSATAAIETVLSGIDIGNIEVFTNGEFGDRLETIAQQYRDPHKPMEYRAYCQFETSKSIYNFPLPTSKKQIVDCVSGFGYYDFPLNADIAITSSSKILGGMPVLGIIIIKIQYRELLNNKGYYLNLKRIWEYDDIEQTPHTSLMPQFVSLYDSLSNFNRIIMQKRVRENSEIIWSAVMARIGVELLNSNCAPVLTLKFDEEARFQKFVNLLFQNNMEVYLNPKYMKDGIIQIATYNYDSSVYKILKEILISV